MTYPDLIASIDARGVRLSARLGVDAPAGSMTPELRDALAEHRALLLQRLVREMAWAELSPLRWGDAVGDPTPGEVVP
jgi:TubC N-terminal docking domain